MKVPRWLSNLFIPEYVREQMKNVYQRKSLKKGLRIAVLGGVPDFLFS